MIDWEKTAEYHNKTQEELKSWFEKYPKSNKKIFVICDKCKKEWEVYYWNYQDHGLCASCIQKGENNSFYKNSIGNEYFIEDNKKIIILKEIGYNKSQKIVLAQCHCGNKFEVLEQNLKRGQTKSCGHCLEKTEIGKIKNGIELLKFEYRDKNSYMYFKAKCHCGNIFIIKYNHWKNGQKSCGKCPRICPTCKKEFIPNYYIQKYCSKECNPKDWRNWDRTILLNEYIPGMGWSRHHITEYIAITLPDEIHYFIDHCLETKQGMKEINKLAWQFLFGKY